MTMYAMNQQTHSANKLNLHIPEELEEAKRQCVIAARWYWVQAAQCLAQRDYRAMRKLASLATERETNLSPYWRLVGSIFDADILMPDVAEVARGEKVPVEQAEAAKRAVLAEIKAHDARMAQKRAEERAKRAELARRERVERRQNAENGVPQYLRDIHDSLFDLAERRRFLRKVEGFLDSVDSITKNSQGTVGLLIDRNGEYWGFSKSWLWALAFRREGAKRFLNAALVRVAVVK